MDDLISRQEAIEAIKELCEHYTPIKSTTHPHMEFVIEELQNLPSVPRKGKWIIDNPHSEIYRYACSECHAHHRARYDFCPSCGTDMRPQFEEPEINPCRGCEDYDGKGGCKSKGGCAGSRGEQDV